MRTHRVDAATPGHLRGVLEDGEASLCAKTVHQLQAYLAQVRQDMEKEDIELHHATTLLANGRKKPSSHVQGHSSKWTGSWVSCFGATEAEKQSITALQQGYQGIDKGDAKFGRQYLSPVCFEESLTTQATDNTAEMLQTLGRQSLSEMLQAGRQSLSPFCSEESLTNQATDNTADMLQTSPIYSKIPPHYSPLLGTSPPLIYRVSTRG